MTAFRISKANNNKFHERACLCNVYGYSFTAYILTVCEILYICKQVITNMFTMKSCNNVCHKRNVLRLCTYDRHSSQKQQQQQ